MAGRVLRTRFFDTVQHCAGLLGKWDGKQRPNITLNKCRDCGGIILPNTALDQIAEAFRSHAKLLTAKSIRGELRRLQLSQKEFATLLGVAPETVSRWLTSVLPGRRVGNRLGCGLCSPTTE